MKAAIGDCCQAYSLLKKLVSREPCKARSIIRAHSMKEPKERLHATWQEFLLNFDGANVRGFADCMDTLKHATSDRYSVHSRHAIFSGTIAHMEERGIVFDLAVITQFFIDGTKDEALRQAVIIPYQQRMGRHLRQLNVKKSDPSYVMTEPEPPSETWFELSEGICNVVDQNPSMDTGPHKVIVEEPEVKAFAASTAKPEKSRRVVKAPAKDSSERTCWVCGLPGHIWPDCTSTHCSDCKRKLPSDKVKHRGNQCPARKKNAGNTSTQVKRSGSQQEPSQPAKKPKYEKSKEPASSSDNQDPKESIKALTAMVAKLANGGVATTFKDN